MTRENLKKKCLIFFIVMKTIDLQAGADNDNDNDNDNDKKASLSSQDVSTIESILVRMSPQEIVSIRSTCKYFDQIVINFNETVLMSTSGSKKICEISDQDFMNVQSLSHPSYLITKYANSAPGLRKWFVNSLISDLKKINDFGQSSKVNSDIVHAVYQRLLSSGMVDALNRGSRPAEKMANYIINLAFWNHVLELTDNIAESITGSVENDLDISTAIEVKSTIEKISKAMISQHLDPETNAVYLDVLADEIEYQLTSDYRYTIEEYSSNKIKEQIEISISEANNISFTIPRNHCKNQRSHEFQENIEVLVRAHIFTYQLIWINAQFSDQFLEAKNDIADFIDGKLDEKRIVFIMGQLEHKHHSSVVVSLFNSILSKSLVKN